MKIGVFDEEKGIDKLTLHYVDRIASAIEERNDDFVLLIVGDVNSGKSMLSLKLMDVFLGSEANTKWVCFDKATFSDALADVAEKPGRRMLIYDEGNLNKRDSMTKWNRQLIDTFYSIRGLNIFHVWCNPSANVIDKTFLTERVNGLILIVDKNKNKPRRFFYYTKRCLLKHYAKYNSLSFSSLKKVARKYAFSRGCFSDYTGSLKVAYNSLKTERMKVKVQQLREEFGAKFKTLSSAAKFLGLSRETVSKHVNKFIREGLLVEGRDFFDNFNGTKSLSSEGFERFKQLHVEAVRRGF